MTHPSDPSDPSVAREIHNARDRVLARIAHRGDATLDEIQHDLGLTYRAAAISFGVLLTESAIEATGRTRPDATGCPRNVFAKMEG